jgi:hypothetical protein
MRRLISLLLPFFLLCVVLSAFVLGMILLSYLFIFGALAGIVLFFIAWIRKTFFPPKILVKPPQKQAGRIIDSDEWNQL